MTTTYPYPTDGLDRCDCGCKYWEHGRCIDCGARPQPRRMVAARDESDACERGTDGCAIDHTVEAERYPGFADNMGCEPW